MNPTRCAMSAILALTLLATTTGCGLNDPGQEQHGGTTVMLVGLSKQEAADQDATTLGCARTTISWAAKEGSNLIMAPVSLPGEEQWLTVDFALRTSAEQTNPVAAKRLQVKQGALADSDLAEIQRHTPKREALNLLADAIHGSRLLNYQRGPRTLILCTSGQQHSPELTLGPRVMSHNSIYATLASLQAELEPMRLTRVIFGAAGDAEQPNQSLTELAA